MRIFCISDTHCQHNDIIVPDKIDILIHAGDFSNSKMINQNIEECKDFLHWFEHQKARYKILIAGNHEVSFDVPKPFINAGEMLSRGIIYLQHESIEIDGINIFGSPYTPEYHNWAFNRDRNKLGKIWDQIPEDTNILVTHGPPKGILDKAHRLGQNYESVGDSALLKKIMKLPNLQYVINGHIHDNVETKNAGIYRMLNNNIIFANVSSVKDGNPLKIVNNGYLFEI